MNICVFCSMYEVDKKYTEPAAEFARMIGEGGHTLVWGGTDSGIMHVIAEEARRAGARLVGVIRKKIKNTAYKNTDELVVVAGSKEMNLALIERAEAIALLVGGVGSLNEVTEILRMVKNKDAKRPIIVLNTDGFYDGFRQQLERMHNEGFVTTEVFEAIRFVDTPREVMEYIEA